jgi:hypothetical protein
MITLRDYQLDIANRGVEILRQHKILYLSMQVRTGKTFTALHAASLYGAKKVLFLTKKKTIDDIERQREMIKEIKQADKFIRTYVTNYEMIKDVEAFNKLYAFLYDTPVKSFDLIICDEAHVLGAFPDLSLKTKLLKKIAKDLPIIYLSGTPSAESYSQLFHQFWISSFSPWISTPSFHKWVKAGYVEVKKKYLYNREINDYSDANKEKIDADTAHLFISFSQEQAGFTEYVDEEVLTVKMSDKTYRIADRLIKDKIVTGSSGSTILADTAVKLQQKLHQIYSGTVITEGGVYIVTDYSKAMFIGKTFRDKRICVFYKFKSELDALEFAFGGDITESVEEFNEDPRLVFVSQIQSGREGLNLSKADALVMYNIDFSAVSYWQARARLQTKDRTTPAKVYWIFSEGGIEHKIYEAVQQKKDYTLSYFKKDYLSKIAGSVPKSVSKRS